ncbi:MAG: PilZ domain-containing protein [Syntrophobacteraceae bacterium]
MHSPGDAAKVEANGALQGSCIPIDLPLAIGGELIVRSLSNPALRTKSKIVGAMHNEYILITEPVMKINERLGASIDGGLLCSYFTGGNLYTFRSKCRQSILKNVTVIDYPGKLDIKQIRSHRRIRVNIETEFVGPANHTPVLADMVDISHGGCRLVFEPAIALLKDMHATITFSLPNEQMVRKMRCQVMSVSRLRGQDSLEAGLKFIGPASAIDTIRSFCEFCMFFELE